MFKAKATRNERIATLSGHVFNVVAGTIYEFPDAVQTDAILGGCIPVEDAPSKEEPVNEADREAAIYNAVMEIISKGDARVLGPEGYPKVAAIKKMVGFDPTIEEIVAAANQLKQDD